MKQLILVVEDESNIANLITSVLKSADYQVVHAEKGHEALSLVASHNPDVIILDLGLPDMDGMEVIRAVREFYASPVIVVSARTHEREKVAALDGGADDYIMKPFSPPELLARIRTALRHKNMYTGGSAEPLSPLHTGGLVIDYDRRVVTLNGDMVHFTPVEYKIVTILGRHIGKVLTHDFIMKHVWGPYVNENHALRVNMANIRRKIEKNPAEPEYIVTEIGVGYRMTERE